MKRKTVHQPLVRVRRRARSFGSASPLLLGSVGADGRFKFLTSAWASALGYPGEELRERPLHELVPLERSDAVAVVSQLLDTAKPGPMEFRLRCKDGTHKRFLWHRRFDPELQRMYVAGEELAEQNPAE